MSFRIKLYNNDESGSVCHAKLESGDLIRIWITYGPVTRLGVDSPRAPIEVLVQTLKWGGLRKGEDIFVFDLLPERNAGRMCQLPLVKRSEGPVWPLDSMIDYLKDCRSVAEVKQQCDRLATMPLPDYWTE